MNQALTRFVHKEARSQQLRRTAMEAENKYEFTFDAWKKTVLNVFTGNICIIA